MKHWYDREDADGVPGNPFVCHLGSLLGNHGAVSKAPGQTALPTAYGNAAPNSLGIAQAMQNPQFMQMLANSGSSGATPQQWLQQIQSAVPPANTPPSSKPTSGLSGSTWDAIAGFGLPMALALL